MKKIFVLLYIVLFLILFKLMIAFGINETMIKEYQEGNYDVIKTKILLILNISEPYIAHYNYGNQLYQKKDFDGAIQAYKKALKLHPTQKKECAIRINLALAMLQQINEQDTSEANRNRSLSILGNAKQVLCENGCANEKDNNGHSKEAEQLKADIEKKEKELKKDPNQKSQDEKEKEEPNEERKEEVKEKLKEIQKQSTEARQSGLNSSKNLKNYNYYSGKKW